MIRLIGAAGERRYRAAAAMDHQADCVSIVRRLLEPPGASFAGDLALAAGARRMPPDAAEQVARFSERIADLSAEERRELFDETFGRPATADDRRRFVALLKSSSDHDGASDLWPLVERLGAALLRDRNPYHHLIAAVGVLLR
jgi:nitrate reductase assembly molybdenum cofactor insertion protein NarJ